jgi:hypothetical protein
LKLVNPGFPELRKRSIITVAEADLLLGEGAALRMVALQSSCGRKARSAK